MPEQVFKRSFVNLDQIEQGHQQYYQQQYQQHQQQQIQTLQSQQASIFGQTNSNNTNTHQQLQQQQQQHQQPLSQNSVGRKSAINFKLSQSSINETLSPQNRFQNQQTSINQNNNNLNPSIVELGQTALANELQLIMQESPKMLPQQQQQQYQQQYQQQLSQQQQQQQQQSQQQQQEMCDIKYSQTQNLINLIQKPNEDRIGPVKEEIPAWITKFLLDCEYSEDSKVVKKCHIISSTNKGWIHIYNLMCLFDVFELTFVPHSNQRMNYNPYRNTKEIFSFEKISKSEDCLKLTKLSPIQSECKVKDPPEMSLMKSKNLENTCLKFEAHKDTLTTLAFISIEKQYILTSSLDCYVKLFDQNSHKLEAAFNINHPLPIIWDLYVSHYYKSEKRIMFALRILDIIFRKYKEQISYAEERNMKITNFLNEMMLNPPEESFQQPLQQQPQQSINQISLQENTRSSYDPQVSLNQSLQSITNMSPKAAGQQQQTGYSQKEQQHVARIGNALFQSQSQQIAKEILKRRNTLIEQLDEKKLRLMRDEYEPRDLKFRENKHFYKNELTGSSLKKMDANKRVAMVQQIWQKEDQQIGSSVSNINHATNSGIAQNNELDSEYDKQMQILNQRTNNDDRIRRQNEDREQIAILLDVNYKKKILYEPIDIMEEKSELKKKLLLKFNYIERDKHSQKKYATIIKTEPPSSKTTIPQSINATNYNNNQYSLQLIQTQQQLPSSQQQIIQQITSHQTLEQQGKYQISKRVLTPPKLTSNFSHSNQNMNVITSIRNIQRDEKDAQLSSSQIISPQPQLSHQQSKQVQFATKHLIQKPSDQKIQMPSSHKTVVKTESMVGLRESQKMYTQQPQTQYLRALQQQSQQQSSQQQQSQQQQSQITNSFYAKESNKQSQQKKTKIQDFYHLAQLRSLFPGSSVNSSVVSAQIGERQNQENINNNNNSSIRNETNTTQPSSFTDPFGMQLGNSAPSNHPVYRVGKVLNWMNQQVNQSKKAFSQPQSLQNLIIKRQNAEFQKSLVKSKSKNKNKNISHQTLTEAGLSMLKNHILEEQKKKEEDQNYKFKDYYRNNNKNESMDYQDDQKLYSLKINDMHYNSQIELFSPSISPKVMIKSSQQNSVQSSLANLLIPDNKNNKNKEEFYYSQAQKKFNKMIIAATTQQATTDTGSNISFFQQQ